MKNWWCYVGYLWLWRLLYLIWPKQFDMIDKVNKTAYLTYNIRLRQVIFRHFIENRMVGLAFQGRVLNEKRMRQGRRIFVCSIDSFYQWPKHVFSDFSGWITRIWLLWCHNLILVVSFRLSANSFPMSAIQF